MALFWQRKRDVLADSGLQLQCQVEGAHFVVLLSGRITIDSSPALRAELLRVLESGNCQTLTVDLHEVSYVDTSGVAILMEVLQGARATGKAFQLDREPSTAPTLFVPGDRTIAFLRSGGP